MYAVVETGGKQYKVEPETLFKVEKLDGKVGDEVVITKVVAMEKMGELKIGNPYVKGAVVKAEIMEQGKDRKITVFKYKPKKGVRVKNGHRQMFTLLKIKEIASN